MNYQGRHDLAEYPIQEHVRLDVYWRDDRAGRGPAASLYVYDEEVLRLDCFDGDQGHCHMNLRQNRGQRWYYPVGGVKDHIKRSAFELGANTPACISMNHDPQVQAVKTDPENLKKAAALMEGKMLEFVEKLGL